MAGRGRASSDWIIRLTLLAPDIVEAILMGEEPNGLLLTMPAKQLPLLWDEQRKGVGFADSESSKKTPP